MSGSERHNRNSRDYGTRKSINTEQLSTNDRAREPASQLIERYKKNKGKFQWDVESSNWDENSRSGNKEEQNFVSLGDIGAVDSNGRPISLEKHLNRLKLKKSPTKYFYPTLDRKGSYQERRDESRQKPNKNTICVCGASAHYERERVQIERMKKQVKLDTAKIDSLMEEIQEERQKIESQTEDFNRREALLNKAHHAVESDRAEVEKLWEELKDHEAEMRELEELIDKKEKSCLKKAREFQKLKNDLELGEDALNKREADLESREAHQAEEAERLTELAESLRDAQHRLDESRADIERTQVTLEEQRRVIAQREQTLNEELSQLEDQKLLMEKNLSQLTDEMEQFHIREKELHDREQRANTIITEEKQLRQKIDDYEAAVTARLQARDAELTSQEQDLLLKIEDHEANIKLKKEWLDAAVQEVEKSKEDLNNEMETQSAKLENTRAQMQQQLYQERGEIKSSREQLERDIAAFNDKRRELERKETDFVAKSNELELAYNDLRNQQRTKEREWSDMTHKIQNDREELENDYTMLEERIGDMEDRFSELEQEQFELNRMKKEFEIEVKQKMQEFESVRAGLERQQAQLDEAQRQWAIKERTLVNFYDNQRHDLEKAREVLREREREVAAKKQLSETILQQQHQVEDSMQALRKAEAALAEREEQFEKEKAWIVNASCNPPVNRHVSRSPSGRKRSYSASRRAPLSGLNNLPSLTMMSAGAESALNRQTRPKPNPAIPNGRKSDHCGPANIKTDTTKLDIGQHDVYNAKKPQDNGCTNSTLIEHSSQAVDSGSANQDANTEVNQKREHTKDDNRITYKGLQTWAQNDQNVSKSHDSENREQIKELKYASVELPKLDTRSDGSRDFTTRVEETILPRSRVNLGSGLDSYGRVNDDMNEICDSSPELELNESLNADIDSYMLKTKEKYSENNYRRVSYDKDNHDDKLNRQNHVIEGFKQRSIFDANEKSVNSHEDDENNYQWRDYGSDQLQFERIQLRKLSSELDKIEVAEMVDYPRPPHHSSESLVAKGKNLYQRASSSTTNIHLDTSILNESFESDGPSPYKADEVKSNVRQTYSNASPLMDRVITTGRASRTTCDAVGFVQSLNTSYADCEEGNEENLNRINC